MRIVKYIDMLNVFDEFPGDLNQKKLYSKKKILELTKSLKEGGGNK